MHPVIALLTDFGVRDHYVGSMKGVLLSLCPEASLVDITHDVPAQDVMAGALELLACYRHFPAGTVFLAVVDPGVGSARRPIAASAGMYRFAGPDNGLFAPVFAQEPPERVVELSGPRFAGRVISRTFEGRDRFAPAAAWLAAGVDIAELGPVLAGYEALAVPRPAIQGDTVAGEVVRVDRFGNLVTNIEAPHLAHACGAESRPCEARLERQPPVPLVNTYAEVGEGVACALIGSTGHLEIAVNRGSAADHFRASRGARVVVRRVP